MPSPVVKRAIFGLSPCPQATAFLSRTSGLDNAHRRAYTILINKLVSVGVWAKLDLLQIYATQDQTTANLNLISANNTASTTGSPTWAADVGYTTAAGKWVDCNWNPSTDAIQFSQNAAHICVWSGTIGTALTSTIGMKTTGMGQLQIQVRSTSDQSALLFNDSASVSGVSNTDGSGFFFGVRKDSSTKQIFRNGVQLGADITRSSLTPQNFTLQSCGDNVNSGNSTAKIIRAIGAGGLLTPTDVANYYSALSAFMVSLGATP